jgi:uncharacterized Zn-binding protein involved in type VI secretion
MFAAVSGIAQGDSTVTVNGSRVVVTGDSVAVINGKVYGGADMVKAKGPVVSQRRSLPAFSGIDMMLSADATYRFAPAPGITVSAQSDIMSKIKTTVEGGILVIASDGSFTSDKPIKLLIEGPELSRAAVSGKLVANGLHVNAVMLQVSGSGSIVADGTANEVKTTVSGSGSVELASLRAKSVSADLSGAGLVSAYASESAQVELSGAGTVRISGNPARRSVDRSGAGSVRFE